MILLSKLAMGMKHHFAERATTVGSRTGRAGYWDVACTAKMGPSAGLAYSMGFGFLAGTHTATRDGNCQSDPPAPAVAHMSRRSEPCPSSLVRSTPDVTKLLLSFWGFPGRGRNGSHCHCYVRFSKSFHFHWNI